MRVLLSFSIFITLFQISLSTVLIGEPTGVSGASFAAGELKRDNWQLDPEDMPVGWGLVPLRKIVGMKSYEGRMDSSLVKFYERLGGAKTLPLGSQDRSRLRKVAKRADLIESVITSVLGGSIEILGDCKCGCRDGYVGHYLREFRIGGNPETLYTLFSNLQRVFYDLTIVNIRKEMVDLAVGSARTLSLLERFAEHYGYNVSGDEYRGEEASLLDQGLGDLRRILIGQMDALIARGDCDSLGRAKSIFENSLAYLYALEINHCIDSESMCSRRCLIMAEANLYKDLLKQGFNDLLSGRERSVFVPLS